MRSGAGVSGVSTSGARNSREKCGSPGDCASGGAITGGSAVANLGGGGIISGADSTGSGAGVSGVGTSSACNSRENCGSPGNCASGAAVTDGSASGHCCTALSGSSADWDRPPFCGISWPSDPGTAPGSTIGLESSSSSPAIARPRFRALVKERIALRNGGQRGPSTSGHLKDDDRVAWRRSGPIGANPRTDLLRCTRGTGCGMSSFGKFGPHGPRALGLTIGGNARRLLSGAAGTNSVRQF